MKGFLFAVVRWGPVLVIGCLGMVLGAVREGIEWLDDAVEQLFEELRN